MYLFDQVNSDYTDRTKKNGISEHLLHKYQLFDLSSKRENLEVWINKDIDDLKSVSCHFTLYDIESSVITGDDAVLPVNNIYGLEFNSQEDAMNAVDSLNFGFVNGPLPFFGQVYQPVKDSVLYFGAIVDIDSLSVMKDYLSDVGDIKSVISRDQYIRLDPNFLNSFKNSRIKDYLLDYFENQNNTDNLFARDSEGIYPEFYLTGKMISHNLHDCITAFNSDDLDFSRDALIYMFKDVPELDFARSKMTHMNTSAFDSEKREHLRDSITDSLLDRGSYHNEGSLEVYDGKIDRDGRLDIVLGVPGTDSTPVCKALSEEHHSHIVDENFIQKDIPEFDNGWGYKSVHAECEDIEDKALQRGFAAHENMILSTSDFADPDAYDRLFSIIDKAKDSGYHVALSFLKCDRNIILKRNLEDFINGEGRFIDPELMLKDYFLPINDDLAERVYDRFIGLDMVDEYHKYNNNVRLTEKSVPVESGLITADKAERVSENTISYNNPRKNPENIEIVPATKFHR